MRLPQVSSNITAVIGPMLCGAPRKLTAKRVAPVLRIDVVRYESDGWNAGGKYGLLGSARAGSVATHRVVGSFRASYAIEKARMVILAIYHGAQQWLEGFRW
jgi:hypothetical protein